MTSLIKIFVDCSQQSFFSCFSSIVERGERAASQLHASAKRKALRVRFACRFALKNREVVNSLKILRHSGRLHYDALYSPNYICFVPADCILSDLSRRHMYR